MPETMLDARGLKCPLPVLRARKAMQGVAPGEMLRVLATDPAAVRDFEAFCDATGYELVERGERRIPVQYAKRVVGRRVMGGQSTHMPLKVNAGGVIPVIFASSILAFPQTLMQLPGVKNIGWLSATLKSIAHGEVLYYVLFVAGIIFFCFFYVSIIFNPNEAADNMRKYGGFIPGMRPGKRTAEYIDRTLTRLTFVGAIYLSFVVILPDYMIRYLNVPFYFGGTGLLIVVGVAMDTMQQIESHLVMRHYESFLKKGRLRGRR